MASDAWDDDRFDQKAAAQELQTQIEDLESRINELESGADAGTTGISGLYVPERVLL